MSDLTLFLPITKVDAERRLVYGRLAAEEVDKSGEIFDYATSKPHFQKWSDEFTSATGGLSAGNLRAMHGKVAAGKFTSIQFLDDQKAIEAVAKVVDDAEWNKTLEGVYTGFSIGGKYAKRWADGDYQRYEAVPAEGSLVDSPCMPSARFSILKADGTLEEREFKSTPADVRLALEAMAARLDAFGATLKKSLPEPAPTLEKREFATAERKKLARSGAAMHDGSFPIVNKQDLKNAISAIGRAKNPGAAKAHIKRRARALGATELLPDTWKAEQPDDLQKGMPQVQWLAGVLDSLNAISDSVEVESAREGDHSPLVGELKAAVSTLCSILRNMVVEETTEMVADDDEDIEMASTADELKKTEPADTADELKKTEPAETDDIDTEGLVVVLGKLFESQTLQLAKLEATIERQSDEIAEMKKMAAPGGPLLKGVPITKEQDSLGGSSEYVVRKSDGTVDATATELKKALAHPVPFLGGGTLS